MKDYDRLGLLPEYFLHRLPENQVVLPEYYFLFCPKIAIWKLPIVCYRMHLKICDTQSHDLGVIGTIWSLFHQLRIDSSIDLCTLLKIKG